MSYNYLFKFITVGDSGVGKSCLLRRFETEDFSNLTPSTVGIEYIRKNIDIDGNTIMLQVWDTAGQECMFSLTSSYYKNCCAIILVYDVTRRETFVHLKKWLEQINDNSNQTAKRILVGNKIDQDFERLISRKEAENFAKEHNFLYIETSAKTSKNVNELFYQLAHNVYFEMKKGGIEVNDDGMYGIKKGSLTANFNQAKISEKTFNIEGRNKLALKKEEIKSKCCN